MGFETLNICTIKGCFFSKKLKNHVQKTPIGITKDRIVIGNRQWNIEFQFKGEIFDYLFQNKHICCVCFKLVYIQVLKIRLL